MLENVYKIAIDYYKNQIIKNIGDLNKEDKYFINNNFVCINKFNLY